MPRKPPTHRPAHATDRRQYDRSYNRRRKGDPRSTARWQRVRRLKLAQDPLCEQCLDEGVRRPAEHVHHVVGIKDGGAMFDLANLQSICVPHHAKENARERKERRR